MKPFKISNGKGLVPTVRNMFDDFWGADKFFDDDFFHLRNHWMPAVNIKDKKTSFELDVAAPGLVKDDFDVKIENGMLCISAEKEESMEENDDNFTRKEFSYGSFERSFALPENVDPETIVAKYKNGVLKLTLKKTKQLEPKVKKIDVG